MTAPAIKSAGDKANPTGEARAAKLIAWFNAGAGGKIAWGTPGDWEECRRIAGKHMTPRQSAGFCAERHHDATGEWPGPKAHGGKMRKSLDDIPAAIVCTDIEGRQVVTKLAGLRLEVIDGPGLVITYGDTVVQLDGGDVPEGATHLSTSSGPADDGGHFDSGGLSIDPRTVPGGWAYEVKVEGRRVLWMPAARSVPEWAKGADLVFVATGVETPAGFPARRLRPADDAGTSYLLRQAGMAKSPARKALLKRLGRALMRKSIMGQRTHEETRELLSRAMRAIIGSEPDRYCYVRDLTDEWAVFDLGGPENATPAPGLYRVRYQITEAGDVMFGEAVPVQAHTEYDPTMKALNFGGGSPVSLSAMVALYPEPHVAQQIALAGGYDPADIHVTLCFLGSDAVLKLDREAVEAALAPLAAASAPLDGLVSGIGRFTPAVPPGQGEDEWPLVALIDLPALPEFRQRIVSTLAASGIEIARNHGFCPHATLAMVGPDDEYAAGQILAAGIDPTPLHFGSIVLAWGDDRSVYTLDGLPAAPPPVMKAVAGPAIKSVDAKRYTMAPLYPASPESPTAAHLDAHGDFATAEDLQAAVWDHVRKGDRTIRDQHRAGTAIGEWVEIMSWPYEVTVPMTTADGTTVQKSFAPGTVFLGVVWNELGWSDITKGVKTGYSLGGVATRVAVEMA